MEEYCMALIVIVLFMIYMDNKNNIDGFDNAGAAGVVGKDPVVGIAGGSGDDHHPIKDVQGRQPTDQHDSDIGRKPVKLTMGAPASMVDSLNMVWGAPIGANFMLLSNEVEHGIEQGMNKIETQLPVLHPRVGGVGNLGEEHQEEVHGSAPQGEASQGDGGKTLEVVIIYAPWCGWSKKSLPDFNKMKQNLNTTSNGWTITCVLYDSETPEGKEKVKEYDVKGFPAVFVDINDSRMEGPREYDEMVTLINSKTGGNLS